MSSVIMSWSSFWAFFTRPGLDSDIRIAIAKDLRLEELLQGIPADVQIEVLSDAPPTVIRALSKYLKAKAKIALNIREVPQAHELTEEQMRGIVRRTFG